MELSKTSLSYGVSMATLLRFLINTSLAQSVTLPSSVAVDLVFPRNDTYNPADSFPVVFALQGASTAWTFGFSFEWRIRRAGGCQGECGIVDSGRLSVDQGEFGSVSFGSEDYYLYLDQSTTLSENWGLGVAAGGFEGAYSLEWDFGFLRNCSDDGGAIQSEGGRTDFTGSNIFSLVPGASPDVRAQLEECPISGGVTGVEANLDGCPNLGATEAEADSCVVEVPEDVINNVVAQLAAGGSPEQPGAPPIPGVPLPGGPPGVTSIIGYPGDDGGAQTAPVGDSTFTSASPSGISPIPVSPSNTPSVVAPSGISPSNSASEQTSAVPTPVVVNESVTAGKRPIQVAVIALLSTVGVCML